MDYDTEDENIAQTLARELPAPTMVLDTRIAELTFNDRLVHLGVPNGFKIQEIDLERLMPHPRHKNGVASFSDAASFIKYVETHRQAGTTVWCKFNPQTFDLHFTAVLDEHSAQNAGWRGHRATFAPDMSSEWKAWKGKHGTSFAQVTFAEWIEEHADDVASRDNLPTSLQMLQMATEFQANEERALKSSVKLQSGGVRLTYIADPDAGTTESMQMFDKFGLGIPVFQGGAAWALTARLKYRLNAGKVSFHYELVRPDRVHEGAAKELINVITAGIGDVPLLMGSCA